MTTRRTFLAAAAATTLVPFRLRAGGHGGDTFDTPGGPITIHPISHASFVMETPVGTIYVDPVGEPSAYDGLPAADAILITHEHGDHYNAETLAALKGDDTVMLTNPAVFDKLSDSLKTNTAAITNLQQGNVLGVDVDAIPAYNLTEERKNFHPEGRDNGYVLNFEGFRVYISGDTEDIPEMRTLQDIDLAFVCMNLPFTMDAEAAASAVNEFKPTYCYPYHYRGRDNGTQDPMEFADMLDGVEARMGPWYG